MDAIVDADQGGRGTWLTSIRPPFPAVSMSSGPRRRTTWATSPRRRSARTEARWCSHSPLRSKVVLQSHLGKGGGEHQTIPYGTPSSIDGRLSTPSGGPLANRSVRVIEHFGDGALIRTRPTQLTTDDSGRFSTKLPAGPSRQVEVKFDGSAKYLPADRVAGSLSVKSRATLRLSSKSVREGGHVRFVGRVAHFGARIPSGGKLLELQVRVQAGRWQTVKHAFRSKASGRYRLGYRFGNHYTQDARFRFRLKVEKEGEWPFRPSTSRQRSLVVEAELAPQLHGRPGVDDNGAKAMRLKRPSHATVVAYVALFVALEWERIRGHPDRQPPAGEQLDQVAGSQEPSSGEEEGRCQQHPDRGQDPRGNTQSGGLCRRCLGRGWPVQSGSSELYRL